MKHLESDIFVFPVLTSASCCYPLNTRYELVGIGVTSGAKVLRSNTSVPNPGGDPNVKIGRGTGIRIRGPSDHRKVASSYFA